jgi:hypothetical protein
MQRSLLSLTCIVMNHHLSLDFLLWTRRGTCHCQYFLLHTYKHFRHCKGMYRLHSPTGLSLWLLEQFLETQVST